MSAEGAIHYSGLVNFKFEKSRVSETHTFPLSQGAVLVGFRNAAGSVEHSATFAIEGAAVSNGFRAYSFLFSFCCCFVASRLGGFPRVFSSLWLRAPPRLCLRFSGLAGTGHLRYRLSLQ